jgi:hypothetical protein
MAPEYPTRLVVFKARFEDGRLKGSIKYVETDTGEPLRVRWAVESKPEDFDEVRFEDDHRGVVFVYTKDSGVLLPSGSGDAVADPLGNSRYRWTESMHGAPPWLMFVLILPEGYTLTDPWPKPAGSKSFDGRLALYWVLKADRSRRVNVEWRVKELESPLGSEVERINRSYVSDRVLIPSTMFYIDETIA